jgi:hypothetical protein
VINLINLINVIAPRQICIETITMITLSALRFDIGDCRQFPVADSSGLKVVDDGEAVADSCLGSGNQLGLS